MLCWVLFALTHEGADRRWRAVQNVHLQLLDDLPPAIPCWRVWRPFVHHLCCAVRERAVDDVGVPGDPANIRRAPVDIVGLDVEDGAMRERCAEQISSTRVHDPLRLRRGAARVEQEEELFGGHRIGGAVGRLRRDEILPPVVAASLHRRLARRSWLATAIDERGGDRWRLLHRLVGDRLQLEEAPLPVATVGGDQHLRLGVVDAVGECRGRKAGEDHAVRRTEARAGEHGDCHLRDHRHVDRHAIALANAERLQRIRGLLHLAVQVVVGEGAPITRLADPVNGDLLAKPRRHMAVNAVLCNVQRAVGEPLGEREVPLQRLGEGGAPGEALTRLLRPEGNGVDGRFGVDRGADVGSGGRGGVRWEGEARRLECFNRVLLRVVLIVSHAPPS